uniref:Tegument protein UL25 n=1 Tax=Mastomys natalensis cytomegalovirus 1 TaxID=2973541 RepID=A0A9Y1IQB5_9BETA|nr:tegument protein UL25 [Mastomys natalensis cytomegalovirus 1]WEG68888.1 tegument protein UL25 [Mastomys natalensis cytomegalovirus 1]WEG71116.1 tegument protein UL25 [Mastomys natalensis cytomegalovirus 1]
MNRRRSRDRKLFVTDDEVSDTGESLSQAEDGPDATHLDDLRDHEITDHDDPRQIREPHHSPADLMIYADPADAIYMPHNGGKSVNRAPMAGEEPRDRSASSPTVMFDSDGYAMIPEGGRRDAETGEMREYENTEPTMVPPKLPRKQTAIVKRPISITAGLARQRSLSRGRARHGSPARYSVPRSTITTRPTSMPATPIPAPPPCRPLPPLPATAVPTGLSCCADTTDAPRSPVTLLGVEDSGDDPENFDNDYEPVLQISDDEDDDDDPPPQGKTFSAALPRSIPPAPQMASLNPRGPPAFLPPKKRTYTKPVTNSPRFTRELGFSPAVINSSEVRFLKMCIHDGYQHQIELLNTVTPMPTYVLDALAEPVISRRAVRCAGLVKPITKLTILINYYHVAVGRLASARAMARALLNPQMVDALKRKLEPLLPISHNRAPSPILRMLGRLNITDQQHRECADVLDGLLKPMCEPELTKQRLETARMFRARNLLFKPLRFTRESARQIYLRNLHTMNSETEDGELFLVMSTQPHPTRDDVLHDAIFSLALGNFIHTYGAALADLRNLIHFQLEDMTELLYYAYYQLPRMQDDYRVFCHEVASEVTSGRDDGLGMASLARRMIAFARRCSDNGIFITPTYIKFLLRSAALHDAGYAGFSTERAAASLANTDIFRPIPSEASARGLLPRTVHFSKVEPPTASGRPIPTTHIPSYSSLELYIRALRTVAPLIQRFHHPDVTNNVFSPPGRNNYVLYS